MKREMEKKFIKFIDNLTVNVSEPFTEFLLYQPKAPKRPNTDRK